MNPRFGTTACCLVSALAFAHPACAQHVDVGSVVRGNVSVNSMGGATNITASDGAIIRFNRFDIPLGNSVNFSQPSEMARVLGRITSGAPSAIDGTLTANGILYLVNPSGIVFGPGSIVDTAGIYAAAGNISDADFLSGFNTFTTSGGVLETHGVISADSLAHLIGTRVVNTGTVVVPSGTVTMSAGDEIFIGEAGGRVMVRVDASAPQAGASAVGVDHSGAVESRSSRFTTGDVYSIVMRPGSTVRSSGADVGVTTDAGSIDLQGEILSSGASAGETDPITSEAVAGGAFNGPVFDDLQGAIDGVGSGGPTAEFEGFTFETTGGDLNLGTVISGGPITLSAPGTIRAYRLESASAITLRASALEFGIGASVNGVVASPGVLRIHPLEGSDLFIGVPGVAPGSASGLVLTPEVLAAFAPGFSLIEFGAHDTRSITIGGVGAFNAFADPVRFQTSALSPANFINIGGTLTAMPGSSFEFLTRPGEIRLGGVVQSFGGGVTFGAANSPGYPFGVRVIGDSRIDTTLGAGPDGQITFSGGIEGPFSLAINAGAGSPFFGGNIGAGQSLSSFVVESAGTADLSSRTVRTSTLTSINAQTIDLSGTNLMLGGGDALFAHGVLRFDGGTSISGSGATSDVTVRGRTGSETLGVNVASSDLAIDLALADQSTVARFIVGGAQQRGRVTVGTDADLSITAFGGRTVFETSDRIDVNGRVASLSDLTFEGETVLATDAIVGRDVVLAGETTVASPTIMLTGTQRVAFERAVNSATGQRATLTVNSPSTQFLMGAGSAPGGEFSLVRTDGVGATTITGDVRAIGDGTSATGVRFDDDVTLNGTITVTDGALNIGGDLLLEGDSVLDSQRGPGIVVAGAIDSATGEAHGLSIFVDGSPPANPDEPPAIVLGGDIGVNGALGDLILNANVTGAGDDPAIDSVRASSPRVATVLLADVTLNENGTYSLDIIAPSGGEDAGAARFVVDRFIAGVNEKITALGSVEIDAQTLAASGDITALNDLVIDSPVFLTLLRDPGTVRSSAPRDGVDEASALADLVAPLGPDEGTGYVSGGTLVFTGEVRTRAAGVTSGDGDVPTFASVAALFEPVTIMVNGEAVDVRAIDFGISPEDLRLGADVFASDLRSDVLLDLFVPAPLPPTVIPVGGADPSGQSGLGDGESDRVVVTEFLRRFRSGGPLNEFDRATLARYGVRTRLVDDRGAAVYDDAGGGEIAADRIWAVNAREYARYVLSVFEADESSMPGFREALATALASPGATPASVASDPALQDGFVLLDGAIARLRALTLSGREFERARSLLLSIHVVGEGVSEAELLAVLDAWRSSKSA